MDVGNLLLWVVYPYLVLMLFTVAILYRFVTNQYGWTAKSSEILEKRLLRWGSLLFHWGIVFVFLGHVAGLLVPVAVYHALGVPDELYHALALTIGNVAGASTFLGLLILLYRRTTVRRIKVTSSVGDFVALIFLLIVVFTGMNATGNNSVADTGFDYRTTINPWIRGILLFHPDPTLMTDVPSYFKVHIVAAFGLLAAFPFTRLVHVFSLPLAYLWRSYVLYRKRGAQLPQKD